jgi:hypothetical protein
VERAEEEGERMIKKWRMWAPVLSLGSLMLGLEVTRTFRVDFDDDGEMWDTGEYHYHVIFHIPFVTFRFEGLPAHKPRRKMFDTGPKHKEREE